MPQLPNAPTVPSPVVHLAVIYARQSDQYNGKRLSDDSESLSLEAQISECRSAAASEGDRIGKVYAEQFTGLSADRPEYSRMLADIRANIRQHPDLDDPRRIRKIYVYKYVRLGREPNDVVPIIGYFRSMGIEVIPANDQRFGTGPLDDMMLYMLTTFGKIQVQDAVSHANAVRRRLEEAGKLVCAGKPLYGYKYDLISRQRVIDPDTASVVKRIIEEVARGVSVFAVANGLTADQIPTPRGKIARWSEQSIRRIIKNPSYYGEAMMQGRYQIQESRYKNGKRKIVDSGKGRPVGEPTPAIVSRDIWNQANKNVSNRSKPMVRGEHWLIGRIYCAKCQKVMIRQFHYDRNKNIDFFYWVCNNARKKLSDCKMTYINNNKIEPQVWARIQQWYKKPGHLESKLKELEDKIVDPAWEVEAERNAAEIAKLKKGLAKLLDAFGTEDDPIIAEAIREKVQKYRDDIVRREGIAASIADRVSRAREARAYVDGIRDSLADRLRTDPTEEERCTIAKAIGLTVTVHLDDNGRKTVRFRAFDYAESRYLPDRPFHPSHEPDYVPYVTSSQTRGRSTGGRGASARST